MKDKSSIEGEIDKHTHTFTYTHRIFFLLSPIPTDIGKSRIKMKPKQII